MLVIWILAHRGLVFGTLALSLWVLANWWYLRTDIDRWRRLNRPHSWSVDMATKSSKGGKTKAHH